MRASLSVLTCHHNHHNDNQFVGASKQTNLIDGLQYQFRIIKTTRYSHNAGSLTCCKKVQWPLMFSLALVNGRPMVNGDLREVSMTLYKGSNVECCPRGAAKVTEDNCVWHPQPTTTTGDGGSHQNLSCKPAPEQTNQHLKLNCLDMTNTQMYIHKYKYTNTEDNSPEQPPINP